MKRLLSGKMQDQDKILLAYWHDAKNKQPLKKIPRRCNHENWSAQIIVIRDLNAAVPYQAPFIFNNKI